MKIFKIITLFTVIFTSSNAIAGAVGGPQSKRDTVMPGKSDIYTVVFEAQEPARVFVRGDGSSDLDCYVYDNGGHLVSSDDDSTDVCTLRWTPSWTGKFQIKIVNRGTSANEYLIRTN